MPSGMSAKQIHTIATYDAKKLALWVGAVSGGKTIASLVAFFLAIRHTTGAGLIVIAGKTLQTIERNLIDVMQSPELFGDLADHVHHTKGAPTATILGRTVHLVGANDVRSEEKIRGSTVELAYVDEATILPKGFWEMLVTRLRAPGSRLLATTNPGSTKHWLRTDFILQAEKKNMQVFNFVMDDNPSLTPEYVRDMKASFTGVFYDRFIRGLWTNAEGAIYSMFDPDLHVIRFDDLPPIDRVLCVSIDVGTNHATSAVMLGLGADRKLYLMDELRLDAGGVESARLAPSQQARRIMTWMGQEHHPTQRGLEPEWVVVDTAAADFRQELFVNDVITMGAKKDVMYGIGLVSSLLANGQLLITDRCTGVIGEITEYRFDPKATERGEDAPIKENDDSMDAFRYAVASTEALWRWQIDAQHELDQAA